MGHALQNVTDRVKGGHSGCMLGLEVSLIKDLLSNLSLGHDSPVSNLLGNLSLGMMTSMTPQ